MYGSWVKYARYDLNKWNVDKDIHWVVRHVLVSLADAMTSGVWVELADLQDPELQCLAKSLQATMLHGCATSTVTNYGYAFQHWKA